MVGDVGPGFKTYLGQGLIVQYLHVLPLSVWVFWLTPTFQRHAKVKSMFQIIGAPF